MNTVFLLRLLSDDVDWSDNENRVHGKRYRRMNGRHWGEFDPYVEPLAMTEEDGGKTRVRVHQLVKSLQGMFFRTARFSTYSP